MRMSIVDIGPTAEINVFEVAGNAEATRQIPMFGRGRIDHRGLEADPRSHSTPPGSGSWPGAPPTASSPTSAPS